MEQRCETCKHWQDATDDHWWIGNPKGSMTLGRWGKCARAIGHDGYPDDTASLAWTEDGESYAASLNTHETFGCVQWEPRD